MDDALVFNGACDGITNDASQLALIVLAARGGSVGRTRDANAPVHEVDGIT